MRLLGLPQHLKRVEMSRWRFATGIDHFLEARFRRTFGKGSRTCVLVSDRLPVEYSTHSIDHVLQMKKYRPRCDVRLSMYRLAGCTGRVLVAYHYGSPAAKFVCSKLLSGMPRKASHCTFQAIKGSAICECRFPSSIRSYGYC